MYSEDVEFNIVMISEKTVYLQVAWFNQGGCEFYEKIRFKVTENKSVSYEMQYME